MAKSKINDPPVVEDVDDDDEDSEDDSDDDGPPDLEDGDASGRGKQSKAEKKSRSGFHQNPRALEFCRSTRSRAMHGL